MKGGRLAESPLSGMLALESLMDTDLNGSTAGGGERILKSRGRVLDSHEEQIPMPLM